jgi:predicted nucleic acid-binding protein
MVLVDTSVWVAHFRERQPLLVELLEGGQVAGHPFVTGELACGNLRNRASILEDLATLPVAVRASDDEVMYLLQSRRLWGKGVGWIDLHLLASSLISKCRFWTLDRRLAAVARELDLA